jgi:hypothetical protein
MIENKFFDTNNYLRLLLTTPAIALLDLAACSSDRRNGQTQL